ncbi:c-5 sterol desaturase [Nowakowskiella sp. JEL0078]|nr:c-5 sterol desaturase [Nowakowskiella sp. JEL0078]
MVRQVEDEDSEMDVNQDELAEDDEGDLQTVQELDMEQSAEERRTLHKKIKGISDDFSGMKAELLNSPNEPIGNYVGKLNKTFMKVKTTIDAKLDAEVFSAMSQVAVQRSEQLSKDSGSFDMESYIQNISRMLQLDNGERDRRNWGDLSDLAHNTFKTTPTFGFLLGPLEIQPKQRAVAKQRAKIVKDKKDLVKPKDLTENQLKEKDIDEQKNETATTVHAIFKNLAAQGKQVPFWKFITNPDSYSQTVENLFYVSFLIKEGRASIEDVEGESMLTDFLVTRGIFTGKTKVEITVINMDLVIDVADEYFLNAMYATFPDALQPYFSDSSFILRQIVSLFIVSYTGVNILYFLFSSIDYYFFFDMSLKKSPKYLPNQISKEIWLSWTSFPITVLATIPWWLGELRGDCLVYWIHRFEHHPILYSWLHKPHHVWKIVTPFASFAFHPLMLRSTQGLEQVLAAQRHETAIAQASMNKMNIEISKLTETQKQAGKQWEEAVAAMTKRDESIQSVQETLQQYKEKLLDAEVINRSLALEKEETEKKFRDKGLGNSNFSN